MKNEDNPLVWKALEYFIQEPYKKIHLREFSRKLKISPNSASRFLDKFVKDRFVNEERVANLRYFIANIDSPTFRRIKQFYSINQIENSELIDKLRELCLNLVVFGSVGKGIDSSESDIDILIIGKDKKKIEDEIRKIQKKFNRELNPVIFNDVEWQKQKINNKAFYQDIISGGINLIGEIPI